jgi:penicillin-binding protein 1C
LAIQAVLTAEDHRFYQHLGVDPLALLRALSRNLRSGSFINGGSTITMQLARLSLGLTPGPRALSRKLKEIWLAILIERHHSKDEILAAYLNSAPTGPQRWGLATAARDYLGKDIALVSPGEAAFLAALPKNPSLKNPEKTRQRQIWILKSLKKQGLLDEAALARALASSIDPQPQSRPYLAPHFLTYVKKTELAGASLSSDDRAGRPDNSFDQSLKATLKTTLDLELQQKIEKLVADLVALKKGHGLNQAAVVVMSLPERRILAWVGSVDFYDAQEGQNDGVLALRQPGSALKPFLYQLAFSEGLITPGTPLSDQPINYSGVNGSFSPRNYGSTYHGRVSARQALASSLNIPAVGLLNRLGTDKALTLLRRLGLNSLTADSDRYGLGLALGNGEVSLLALTNAYAALALLGLDGQPTLTPQTPISHGTLLDADAAWLVTDILSDDAARVLGFGQGGVLATSYPAAVKTGTSQNFKDNWCVGYTDKFVIGVWAGDFQATPMNRVSGVTGAGQLWRSIADFLAERQPPRAIPRPPGVIQATICPFSGLLIGPYCPNGVEEYFLARWPLPEVCDHHHMVEAKMAPLALKIVSPQNQQVFALDPGLTSAYQNLMATAHSGSGVETIQWFLNGENLGQGRQILLPLRPGAIHLLAKGWRGQHVVAQAETRFLVK